MKKPFNLWNLASILLIVLLSAWALQSFYKTGLFSTHDGHLHMVKLFWFSQALKEGHFPVRWTETANLHYGYPIFIFYYPLLFYLGSVLVFLSLSLTTAFKIILISSFLLSGLWFYQFLRTWIGNLGALTGAVMYLFAPYRFVSLFVTGRWAESLSFALIPLVFWIFSQFATHGGRLWFITSQIALALFILSHNVQAMIFIPLLFIWSLILLRAKKSHINLRRLLLMWTGGLFLSAFFWIPALYELHWTYQGSSPVYDFRENFPSLRSYLYFPWGYGFSLVGTKGGVSPMIGIAQLISFPIAVFMLWRLKKQKFFYLIILLLVISLVVFFLANAISRPIWELLPFLPSIQFPSRLTTILVFSSSILAALVVESVKPRKTFSFLLAVGFILLAIYGNRHHLRPETPDRFQDADIINVYQNIFGTGETAGENRPIWSVKPIPLEIPKEKISLSDIKNSCLNTEITKAQISPRSYIFNAKNSFSKTCAIQVNTMYYPGWKVFIDGKTMPLLPFTVEENPYGLIRFNLPPGDHEVRTIFAETEIRAGADIISLLMFLTIISQFVAEEKVRLRRISN